ERHSALGKTPERCIELRDLLELIAFRKQTWRERQTRNNIAKISVRKLCTNQPLPAATLERSKVRAQGLAAHIKASQQGGWPGEGVLYRPVFSAEIDADIEVLLRIPAQRACDIGKYATFLGIPAKERSDVDCVFAEVVVVAVNRLKRQATKY